MKSKLLVIATAAAALALALPGACLAQSQAEMQLQQMYTLFQTGCQMQNPAACDAMNLVAQRGQFMQQAGAACQQGNSEACQAYQQLAADTDSSYQQLSQQVQASNYGGQPGGYDGQGLAGQTTHEQRMQAIQQFGAQNTANFNSRMQAADRQQEQFLSTLR